MVFCFVLRMSNSLARRSILLGAVSTFWKNSYRRERGLIARVGGEIDWGGTWVGVGSKNRPF